MTDGLRPVSRRSARDRRDPTGKAALFTGATDQPELDDPGESESSATTAAESPRDRDGAEALYSSAWRPFTVELRCSECLHRSRVSYFDFALLNLPIGVWLPIPGLRFNRRMTCPSCGRWTWLRARWFG